ncbi:NAD(P)-dependent oxidoreductase [Cryobacterium sp. PH31-L1]|uniref:NAD(P)-dependent oxidoreductase n=1 Tax=Cryobacterium sp. PH31-L1 TaxID=3046199 RepID=UPI0024B9ED97|nr:NAD(P)-dependent oxidoreductase [Cryobacterium sp. PH31-L1]MDJ0377317.1 NAD(P)-binding domain-containing protein [Cryobacterium sp. PH31-L1]
MKLAIIGCGEVGRLYAAAAAEAFDVVLCDSFPSPQARECARRLDVELKETIGQWLGEMDRVWACVPGDVAHSAAEAALPFLRSDAVYVDLSTATTAGKKEMGQRMSARNVAYVDAAIMGAIALTGLQTPILLAGPRAEISLADFATIRAPARALADGEPGDAMTLKLLRTVLTKGLEALGVECLIAAESQGVRDELYLVLDDINQAGFTQFLNAIVRTHVVHAERRSHEVHRAIAQLNEIGLPGTVLAGTSERYKQTIRSLRETPPTPGTADHIDSAVGWLLESTLARTEN